WGLPMPTMPIVSRSLADALAAGFSSAAITSRAYQVGSPAAAIAASDRATNPRLDRLPFSIACVSAELIGRNWPDLPSCYAAVPAEATCGLRSAREAR